MATISVVEKLRWMLTFLCGLASPTVQQLLLDYGFGPAELDRGWELFVQAARRQRPAERSLPRRAAVDTVMQLDRWENKWLPLAQACLATRYPAVGERLFDQLKQQRGPQVIISVMLFVDRVAGLRREGEEREARALLARRGLTDSELDRARALLETRLSLGADLAYPAGIESYPPQNQSHLPENAESPAFNQAIPNGFFDETWRSLNLPLGRAGPTELKPLNIARV